MTINEFILLDKTKVRRDSNLMSLYLDFFKTAFGRVPNCAGCSFGTDWQKLVSLYSIKGEKKVTLQKGKIMNTISIKKIQGKILTYRKDGKTFRQYDNILTDEFIKEFIVSGTDEENKERVKMFNFPVEEEIISVFDNDDNETLIKVNSIDNSVEVLGHPSIVEEKTFEEIAQDNVSKKGSIDFTEQAKEASKIIAKSKRGPKKRK